MLASLQERVQEGPDRRGLEDQQRAEDQQGHEQRHRPPELVLPDETDEVSAQGNAIIHVRTGSGPR